MKDKTLETRIFDRQNHAEFEALALDVFNFQYQHVPVYGDFCRALNRLPEEVNCLEDIPFLPIEFFKSHQIIAQGEPHQDIFTSSGTTGSFVSKHYVADLSVYEKSFTQAFHHFYGAVEDYVVLALLPAYLERKGSSLIYMANYFIEKSRYQESGFYLNNYNELAQTLKKLDSQNKKILLIGVSFALLDLIEQEQFHLKNTIIMETGGMKGRRKELTRFELHEKLRNGFGVQNIHSEYGMTELLSQAYSKEEGRFFAPSTMKILIREPEDPFQILPPNRNGGINIIDLANLYSCSFIATQDLGKLAEDGSFEVLGRFDHSDIRGCNLMIM